MSFFYKFNKRGGNKKTCQAEAQQVNPISNLNHIMTRLICLLRSEFLELDVRQRFVRFLFTSTIR